MFVLRRLADNVSREATQPVRVGDFYTQTVWSLYSNRPYDTPRLESCQAGRDCRTRSFLGATHPPAGCCQKSQLVQSKPAGGFAPKSEHPRDCQMSPGSRQYKRTTLQGGSAAIPKCGYCNCYESVSRRTYERYGPGPRGAPTQPPVPP
jgi:hypothetical protein